ncbi:MAG: hypothetical protein ACFHWX_21235 [Bacteroidota bacterium]
MNLLKNNVVRVLLIAVGLFAMLAAYSLILGWSMILLFAFWFILVPSITYFAPDAVFKKNPGLWVKLGGLFLFYAFMVFGTYSHYETDYFKTMIVSAGINILFISYLEWIRDRNPSVSEKS